jgi:putative ABC transport system permease protein
LLTGVFDPPPDGLTVPWGYLAFLGMASVAALIAAVTFTAPYAAASAAERLRVGN